MKIDRIKRIFQVLILAFCACIIFCQCGDITDVHKEYLDKGETVYVGKLDSLKVFGGENRVKIVALNTYLRTAQICRVSWFDSEGEESEQFFNIEDIKKGDSTIIVINSLPEGDYEFYVQTIDNLGNKSLKAPCFGSSYGDEYKQRQPKISLLDLNVLGDGTTELKLSQSPYAVKMELTYRNKLNQLKTIKTSDLSTNIVLDDWEEKDNAYFKIVTHVLPTDKLGFDTIQLASIEHKIKQEETVYTYDKSRIEAMNDLTATSDPGKAHGAFGIEGLFDGGTGKQTWGKDRNIPAHMGLKLNTPACFTEVSIIGRPGYAGWDVVKFELWGRESISDGPDGPTGYKIQAESMNSNFENEATTRGWKRVGKGWFKYNSPRGDPQVSNCVLTEVDNSINVQYLLFRVMTVLTPDVVPVPSDKYFGEDGGYYVGDGVNNNNRAFCIGEITLKAKGLRYIIE